MDDREFDLTLFGATGFVGCLVARHLASSAPAGLHIALAGRSRQRLERVRADLPGGAAGWPLVVADSDDRESMRALAAQTRVVVSTVGPFARRGVMLVDACAELGTDYADLTGEVLFVREIIDRFHDAAVESGARIVVSCGFDSVPSDLAVHLLHGFAIADGSGALMDTTMRVRRLRGGASGGTIDSLRAQLASTRDDRSLQRLVADPAALSGGRQAAPGQRERSRPFIDAETGEWNAPFVMAAYNTRLVRRSDALLDGAYGPAFRYREIVPTGRGLRGRTRATMLAAGVRALMAGMAMPGLRWVIDRLLPAPGEGPDAEQRRAGSFAIETRTRTERGMRCCATVAADGDPGYAATSVMLGQAALALAVDGDRCSRQGGVLTPAVAMGDVLIERLRRQGFTLEVRQC